MKDIDKKGIYKIFNIMDGRYYVGSATISFSRRLTQHKSDLSKNKHRNIHLQRAYNKYGGENFVFVIIEIIDDSVEVILAREQWYLDQKADYNIAICAENNAKGRKATPEQRLALSQARKGRPAWNKGIPFSQESRERMSKSMKGRKVHNAGKVGQTFNPVERSDGKIFNNPTLAANELGVKSSAVISSIHRKNKCQGYTFKYLDKQAKKDA